jgi:NAD(P) transhydrogenase
MSSIGLGFPLPMLLSVLVTIRIITLSSNNMATSWTLSSSSRQTTSINRRERRIRGFSSSSSRLSVSFTPFWAQNQQQKQKQQPTSPSSVVYDLAVIGGGVVGVQAALSAAASPFRKRVILIDAPTASGALQDANGKDLSLGGPTGLFGKALRDSSKQIKVNTLRGMGLREDSIWNEIISNCVELASSNADDVLAQLEAANVTFQQGFCTFCDSGGTDKLIVTQQPNGLQETITTRHVLIATGSQPFRPAGIPFDGGKRVLDSDSINKLQFLPRSIAITGSGIIAVEFAKIFRNLGADVTLIIRDLIPRNALAKIGLDIE